MIVIAMTRELQRDALTVQRFKTVQFANPLVKMLWRFDLNSVRNSSSKIISQRCHCVERTGANRAKRHFVYVHSPDKLVKCQCRVHSSKVFSFDFCPTDKDILAKEDDGYDHTEKIDMFTRFNGPSFTAEEFDSEDFKCDPTEQFQVDCNICWCNKRGDGAKYCTRVACNPKSYPPLQAWTFKVYMLSVLENQ